MPIPSLPIGHYAYTSVGSSRDVRPHPVPGVLLAGGGQDQDPAFAWLCEHARGGDVLVLRASGTGAYNAYIQSLGAVNSVSTLVLKDRAASYDPFVLDRVRRAEAVFIAGGDQAKYVDQWQNTPLQTALNAALANGVPMGGTSAGLAVLGQTLFGAHHGTVTSADVLSNPHDARITLDHDVFEVPNLQGVVTDTHFSARDRMGRLLTFIEDAEAEGLPCSGRGLGVDEKTAVLVDANGMARLVGHGHAYFVQHSRSESFSVFRMDPAAHFNFKTWQGTGGLTYTITLHSGTLNSSTGHTY